ncbi:N-acetylated-alpha-linked acidic dipeptidase-like protein isoform X2 [Varroa destructor]|uniref:Uncharacterized protein n=1 Tax=Varroa destructor TaxID=109461 RepID=A0A7M7KLQ3_VARDE|nr:N-acetylated-alpha-linked acidic dipeptidase-like protein isoform X2 [Varroa destructor]
MSAQYRPYRDEEDVPPEERAWVDDGPSGRIQIYEKTTHDIHHVVTQRHLVLGGCTIAIVAGLIGLLTGYFAHTEYGACNRGRSVALFSVYDADQDVKEKILKYLDPTVFSHHADLLSANLTDTAVVEMIRGEWRKLKLDEIDLDEFTDSVAQQGDQPNTIEIIYTNGTKDQTKLMLSPDEYSFVAFTVNKSIEGKLTYVSKLDRQDFAYLHKLGTVNGTIALARYGVIPLREQIKYAFSLGALGVLLYMDPTDYPTDYNESALPRVSAPYLDLPIQVISGQLASKLLLELDADTNGTQLPMRMRGGFKNVLFVSEPSRNFTIKITTHNKVKSANLTNAIGVLQGRVEPDRYIIVGAGRDSWSPSNVGGTALLLELARVFGQLVKDGWRPRRSIVFISFAGEHMNSAGLSHFLQSRLNVLRGRTVAYIDVTNPVMGSTSILATSSPLLSQALFNASSLVASANGNSVDGEGVPTLYREWLQNFPQQKPIKSAKDIFKVAQDLSGWNDSTGTMNTFLLEPNSFDVNGTRGLFNNYLHSALFMYRPMIRLLDHTDGFAPFLTQAGIPVIQVHSSMDADFRHHMAIGKVVAELIRDLTDSLFLPFNLLEYAVTLQSYTDTAQHHFITLCRKPDSKIFEPLQHAVGDFSLRAAEFHHRQDMLDLRDPMAIRMVNDQLLLLERAFLRSCPNQCLSVTGVDVFNEQHGVATPVKTYPQLSNIFPSVLDLITQSLTESTECDDELGARIVLLVHDITEIIRTATASLQYVLTF